MTSTWCDLACRPPKTFWPGSGPTGGVSANDRQCVPQSPAAGVDHSQSRHESSLAAQSGGSKHACNEVRMLGCLSTKN
ncbi:hypothetical protein CBOM_07459 [Ceraceosorus bombacis]|uniref:Uncharacterized protein n=1 Tax=Ceraceosorus bombacis TaxID=401625 RepID=A0A0P1BCQ4_9BASI|nr:hypothetical protein CBOM_07459 [Ceraceosorus bombacis]